MCGRYNFSAEESEDIRNIIAEIDRKYGTSVMATGEIYPTNIAPVLVNMDGAVTPELLTWGYQSYNRPGVVINARAETAAEKPMFKASLRERRCVIPSNGFFEWTKTKPKQKYRFHMPDANELYMAGIYTKGKDGWRYVILTTEPNESVSDIHNRMPLVLQRDRIHDWIMDGQAAQVLLAQTPPMLEKSAVS